MFLLSSGQEIIIVAIVAVIVIIGLIILSCVLYRKKDAIKVDENLINRILASLGNESNIKSVEVENARLKFLVEDLDLVDLNALKEISEKGVFVSGNNVKCLFKYESQLIAKQILNRKGDRNA